MTPGTSARSTPPIRRRTSDGCLSIFKTSSMLRLVGQAPIHLRNPMNGVSAGIFQNGKPILIVI
jgi:hypothetical protein